MTIEELTEYIRKEISRTRKAIIILKKDGFDTTVKEGVEMGMKQIYWKIKDNN